jgi:hypothetical protein
VIAWSYHTLARYPHPTELAPRTTTVATPTAAGTILALDLGKDKRVACLYDRATAAADFRTLDTSRAELERRPAGRCG